MIEVPVPRNYDSMLRQQYGDYMKIPDNKHENMHGGLIISTEHSYDEWRKLQKWCTIILKEMQRIFLDMKWSINILMIDGGEVPNSEKREVDTVHSNAH